MQVAVEYGVDIAIHKLAILSAFGTDAYSASRTIAQYGIESAIKKLNATTSAALDEALLP